MPGTDDYCLGQNESEAGDLITEAMLCYHPSVDPRLTLYPIGKKSLNLIFKSSATLAEIDKCVI